MSSNRKYLPRLTFLSLILASLACECPNAEGPQGKTSEKTPVRSPAIRILPLGPAPKTLVDHTAGALRNVFPDVGILPAEAMPARAWYAPRQRWRADTLIGWMARRATANEVWLGITTDDISAAKEGVAQDFGIMGLGLKPGRACVASTRRVKDKSQFPKVVIHELGHTAGLPHCPEPRCLMRAADRRDHTRDIDAFCGKCRAFLLGKGWRI